MLGYVTVAVNCYIGSSSRLHSRHVTAKVLLPHKQFDWTGRMLCAAALCLAASIWLTDHGYSPPQRDAVLSYIKRESDFHPDLIERTGVCLMQWAGSRRMQVLAESAGRCPPWTRQLEIADRELRTEPAYRCFWRAMTYTGALSAIRRGFGRGRC